MTDTPPLRRRLALVRLVLLWERLGVAFWPFLTLLGLGLAGALSDLLPLLPPWLHSGLGGAWAVASGLALWHGLRGFQAPSPQAARRRLEQPASHRPLSTLADHPAQGRHDPVTLALWQRHQDHARQQAEPLRPLAPRPSLAAHDPLGLRFVPILALVVVGSVAWKDPLDRLERAVPPVSALFGGGDGSGLHAEVWITPPDFTGLPVLYRSTTSQADLAPLAVPEGSSLMVLVHGSRSAQVRAAGVEVPLTPLSETSAQGTLLLPATGPLRGSVVLRSGWRTRVSWPLVVHRDTPPSIAFTADPEGTRGGRLRLPHAAHDDFGLVSLTLNLSRPQTSPTPEAPPTPDDVPTTLALPLPTSGAGPVVEVNHAPLIDTMAHPWAGLEVEMVLQAEDGRGQTAHSSPRRLILPEREFSHPVARAMIEARKMLAAAPDRHRIPVLRRLEALAATPESFGEDPVVFLGLRIAALRVAETRAGAGAGVYSVLSLLWSLAERLEDGGLLAAAQRLDAAQQTLEAVLADPHSDSAALHAALDELREALRDYMTALLAAGDSFGEESLIALPWDSLSLEGLDALMERLGTLSDLGAREAAQALMNDLRRQLDALRSAQPFSMAEGLAPLIQMFSALAEIIERQEALQAETFSPPPEDRLAAPRLAEEQDAVRRALGQVMETLGETLGAVPDSLGSAELHMREAARTLRAEDWAGANAAQLLALDALRQGQDDTAQQILQALGSTLVPGGMANGPLDPLGRLPAQPLGEDSLIPGDGETRRATEILRELRRRAGDMRRPEDERDYLNRLLQQF